MHCCSKKAVLIQPSIKSILTLMWGDISVSAVTLMISLMEMNFEWFSNALMQAQFLKNDHSYSSCTSSCRLGDCASKTCNGSVTFHVINIRTYVEFVLFSGGYDHPCILKRSEILPFSNPNMPLYAHISSIDSTGSSVSKKIESSSNYCHLYIYIYQLYRIIITC